MLIKLAAAIAAVAMLVAAGPLFHISGVRMSGDALDVTEDEVRTALKAAGSMNRFKIDLDALENGIAQLPQVLSAKAHFESWSTVAMTVVARKPRARTPEGALIDAQGKLFNGRKVGGLPIYEGPLEQNMEFVDLYSWLSGAASERKFSVNRIAWSSNGWQVLVGNGWTLLLGRRDLKARVERFADAYPLLASECAHFAGPLTIDLRYMRGFAIAGIEKVTAGQKLCPKEQEA